MKTVAIFVTITGIMIVMFVLFWTWLRYKKIITKDLEVIYKKIWWVFLGVILLFVGITSILFVLFVL